MDEAAVGWRPGAGEKASPTSRPHLPKRATDGTLGYILLGAFLAVVVMLVIQRRLLLTR